MLAPRYEPKTAVIDSNLFVFSRSDKKVKKKLSALILNLEVPGKINAKALKKKIFFYFFIFEKHIFDRRILLRGFVLF